MQSSKTTLGWVALCGILCAPMLFDSLSISASAQQSRTANEGVYTDGQSQRGQTIYKEQCSACHGATLGGGLAPTLTGEGFMAIWGNQPLSDLAGKIQYTMPATAPGTLTRQQSADVVAHILQVGRFPAGKAELSADEGVLKQITLPAARASAPLKQIAPAPSHTPSYPPTGNLGQIMKGIFFPSSNLIFNVQGNAPGAPKTGPGYQPGTGSFSWVDWGAGIYSGWELVDYAAVTLADAAPLLLTPGRRCENGKPAPVDRPDWVRFTAELVEAGRAAYKASQSRNQEAVIEVSSQVADACLHCHEVYRDKPGGTTTDPSNKAARCVP